MNVTFSRASLRKAVAMAGSVVPLRAPKDVLKSLLVTCDGERAVIVGTSLEITVKATVDGCRAEETGSALIPADKISAIATESNSDDIRVVCDASQKTRGVFVNAGASRWKLDYLATDLFPNGESKEKVGFSVSIDSAALAGLFRRTVFAANDNHSRFAFGGVMVEFGEKQISAVATDGNRMSCASCLVDTPGSRPGNQTIIPAAAVKKLLGVLPESGSVLISATENRFDMECEQASFSARLIEGVFPKKWRSLLEEDPCVSVEIPSQVFSAAVRQVAIAADDLNSSVELTFADGNLRISAESKTANSMADIPIAYNGEAKKVAVRFRYIYQFLDVLPRDAQVTVEVGEEATRLHIIHEAARYVIQAFG